MFAKKLLDFISKLFLMLLMSFSFVYPLTTTLSFKYSPLQVSVIILVLLVLMSVLLINRIMARITLITVISCSIIFVVYSFISGLIFHYTKPFIWLYNYIQSTEAANESFALGYTLALSIIFSLIVYIFTVRKFNFYVIFFVGLSIFCSQWILNYFAPDAYISFYTFVVSVIVYYFLHIYNKKSAQQSNDFANLASFIMLAVPVSLVVLLLTSVIPVSQRPIEWKWLDEKINYAFGYYTNNNGKFMGTDYFSISSAGFGGSDNRLGGDIAPDDSLVLKVNSPKVIYLKGRSCDQYTGNSWVNTTISYSELDDPDNRTHFDTYELEHGRYFLINKYQAQSDSYSDSPSTKPDNSPIAKNFLNMPINNTSVSYNDITTNSLFIPLKSYNFKFSNIDNSDVFVNPEGVLLSRKSLGKGFNYSFDTYNINYGNKDFEKLMSVSTRYIYDEYLELSISKVTASINNSLRSTVEYHNFENEGYFWSDIYELELRKIMLESPTIEAMRISLGDYLVNYFSSMLNMSDEEKLNFENILVDQCLDYIEMQHIYENSQNLFERILTLKQLADNSRTIYAKYLNIPQTVPDRVRDLAVSITKNEHSSYDKVKAIEQYLSKNYKYTYTPGNPPENSDFVDYFLFEHKEGYCTYYASAMSILTRCIGIPSRYAEGYVLPSKPVKGDLYEVTNEQAHAWVEVYFEGIGWIQFEPTSSFSGNLYQQTGFSQNIRTPQSSDYNTQLRTGSPVNNGNFPKQQTNNTKIDYNKLIIIILSILLVIFVLFLIILANIIRRKKVLFNITKLPPREGVLELYSYYMKHFMYQKADFSGGETPMEHAKRLDSIGRFFPHKLQEIAKIFVDARYSQKEISQSDFNKVLSFYQPVLKASKDNLGIVRYTLFMYILFKL